jgi:hypothetical protein
MIEHIPAIDKTMFKLGQDEWGNELRLGKSVLEWLADAKGATTTIIPHKPEDSPQPKR